MLTFDLSTTMSIKWCILFLSALLLSSSCASGKKKKSVLDLNEADVERIFQQWEDNDEESDWGDEGMRPPKPGAGIDLDLEGLQSGKVDPEDLIRQSKKNKPVMMFVGVKGSKPDRTYTEKVSSRWMQSLQNAHLQVQRYVVADDRILFLVEDGSRAWDVKDYLITQTDCTTVSFEQLSFNCAASAPRTEL